jgi:hypothetical protein
MNNREESVPFQVHLLSKAVDEDDQILREYVEVVVPHLINHCAVMSAKGGRAFREYCQKMEYNYHDKADQSMVAHVLNGIFPVMRIARELERRGLQKLDATEQKLYLIAYTLHDLDKWPVRGKRTFTILTAKRRDSVSFKNYRNGSSVWQSTGFSLNTRSISMICSI